MDTALPGLSEVPSSSADDGDTPFTESQDDLTPFFMEDEDEEEEARRLLTACDNAMTENTSAAVQPKPKKKALVKCPQCSVNFFTLEGYFKHRMTHKFGGNFEMKLEVQLPLSA